MIDLRKIDVPKFYYNNYKCVIEAAELEDKDWDVLNNIANKILNGECGNFYIRFYNMSQGLFLLTKLSFVTKHRIVTSQELQDRYENVDRVYDEFKNLRELAVWDVGNEISKYGRYIVPIYYNYCSFNDKRVILAGNRPLKDIYSKYGISGLIGLQEVSINGQKSNRR